MFILPHSTTKVLRGQCDNSPMRPTCRESRWQTFVSFMRCCFWQTRTMQELKGHQSLKAEAPETGMPELQWRPKGIGDSRNIECPLRIIANSEWISSQRVYVSCKWQGLLAGWSSYTLGFGHGATKFNVFSVDFQLFFASLLFLHFGMRMPILYHFLLKLSLFPWEM